MGTLLEQVFAFPVPYHDDLLVVPQGGGVFSLFVYKFEKGWHPAPPGDTGMVEHAIIGKYALLLEERFTGKWHYRITTPPGWDIFRCWMSAYAKGWMYLDIAEFLIPSRTREEVMHWLRDQAGSHDDRFMQYGKMVAILLQWERKGHL